MPFDFNDFHFIRPMLLLLIVPAIGLLFLARKRTNSNSAWQNVISPHLLAFLFVSGEKQTKIRFPFWLNTLIVSLIIFAISGPSFREKPVPVFESENAQVILVDLSLSMDATDLKPSRLERAKFKLLDLLERTEEGTIGLVVYAGDAFVISPLTSDSNTIANMVPTLTTRIMPVLGSRPDIGINKAIELLENAKHSSGQIIWLTDGVEESQIAPIVNSIESSGYSLSILAIGTSQGAPIPLPDGNGFLQDSSGAIVVPKLEINQLNKIAQSVDAGFTQLTADQADIDYLQAHLQWLADKGDLPENQDQKFSRWIDDGYWIIWLVLVLLFIRIIKHPDGAVANILLPSLIFSVLFLTPSERIIAAESGDNSSVKIENSDGQQTELSADKNTTSQTNTNESFSGKLGQVWNDLWSTRDQQGLSAYRQGNYDKAKELFESKAWQATSAYRKGEFADAATTFAATENAESIKAQYNHATALAKAQQLQPALDAYNQLLEKAPEHEDALFNKKIIEEMLKQQQEEQEQNDQNSENQKENDQSQDSSENQQQQDQEDSEQNQEQKEQEESEQQSQEQKEAEQKEQQQAEMTEDERDQSEKDQALEHWLEKIPDDPGGLLRRKMYREYQRRGRQQKEEKLW